MDYSRYIVVRFDDIINHDSLADARTRAANLTINEGRQHVIIEVSRYMDQGDSPEGEKPEQRGA